MLKTMVQDVKGFSGTGASKVEQKKKCKNKCNPDVDSKRKSPASKDFSGKVTAAMGPERTAAAAKDSKRKLAVVKASSQPMEAGKSKPRTFSY